MEAFTEDVGNDPPWEDKTDSRLLWVSRSVSWLSTTLTFRSEVRPPVSCSPIILRGVSDLQPTPKRY